MILSRSGMVQRQAPPNFPASPYFLLFHNPEAWECKAGEWLPRLKRLPLAPGVNAVRQSRNGGAVDPNLAIVQLQQRGFKIIPEDFGGGFVKQVPVAGGVAHMMHCDELKRVGTRAVLRRDDDAYTEFQRSLLAEGVVEPPEPEILEMLIDRQQRRIDRKQAMTHLPNIKAQVKADAEKLKSMKAAANG